MRLNYLQCKGLIWFEVQLYHNQGYEKQQLTQNTAFFNEKSSAFFYRFII